MTSMHSVPHHFMIKKSILINRNLAKYMWFKLIDFAFSDNKLRYIDLGGGQHYS